MRELTEDEIAAVRRQGFVIAPAVLSEQELTAIHGELEAYFPGWIEHCSSAGETALTPAGRAVPGFVEFPFSGGALNAVGSSATLRRNAERILDRDRMFIEQSHLLAKYAGGPADVEQHLHCDYTNHTLLYPTARSTYGHVASILYYTDVGPTDGPTGVVSTEVGNGRILWPAQYSPAQWPDLYEAEQLVTVAAGSMLVYTMRTFHRGTRIRSGAARIVHFVDFCAAGSPWMGIVGWPRFATRQEWTDFVNGASPSELASFGIPLPGDPYWDEEALEGVGRRYPGLDLDQYRERSGWR